MAIYQVWERRLIVTTPTPGNEFIKFKPRYLTGLGPPSAVKAMPISLRHSSPLLLAQLAIGASYRKGLVENAGSIL
jgi:hypothetical protein